MSAWTWFWVGRSANVLAVEITIFTVPVVATVVLGASTGQIATIVAVELLAGLAGPLLLAGIFDARPSRSILLATDLVRAALVAAIPVAALTVGLSAPLLAVLAFGLGVLRFTGFNTVFVATPRLVPDAELERANSQLEGGRRLASTAGPALAGALVAVLGAAWAPAAEAVLLLATAAALLMIPALPPVAGSGGGRRRSGPAAILAGLRTIAASRPLRAVTASVAVFNAVVAGAAVLVPLLVLRELAVDPFAFGIGVAVGAAGGLAGAAIAPHVLQRWGGPPVVMPAALAVAGLATLPLIGWSVPGTPAALVYGVTQFVDLAAVTVFVVANTVLRQRSSPPTELGRTTSAYMLLTRGIAPVGAAAIGWLADTTTVRTAFLVVAAAQVAAGAALFARRSDLHLETPQPASK